MSGVCIFFSNCRLLLKMLRIFSILDQEILGLMMCLKIKVVFRDVVQGERYGVGCQSWTSLFLIKCRREEMGLEKLVVDADALEPFSLASCVGYPLYGCRKLAFNPETSLVLWMVRYWLCDFPSEQAA